MTLMKEEFCTKVGYRVRELRVNKKLSIEKLALEAGIEYTQLSRIELGRINTSIYQIYKISKTLEVTMPEIFLGFP
jgi:transcriptional regulator with XRE-family HTH domain